MFRDLGSTGPAEGLCDGVEESRGWGSEGCGNSGQDKAECLLDRLPLRTPAFTYQTKPAPRFQLQHAPAASVVEWCEAEESALPAVGIPLSEDSIGQAVPESR